MDDLKNFIMQRRAVGESDQDIASELIGAGWDREAVRQAFADSQPVINPATQNNIASQLPNFPVPKSFPEKATNFIRLDKRTRYALIFLVCILALIPVLLFARDRLDKKPTASSNITSKTGTVAPALRDQIRKADAKRLVAAAVYQSLIDDTVTIEATPDSWSKLASSFSDFKDPAGSDYKFTTASPKAAEVQLVPRMVCTGTEATTGGEGNIAVRVGLEDGGVYCADNVGF